MAMNDLLSDMIARIKNGQKARLAQVNCRFSSLCTHVLDVLKNEGYIRDWRLIGFGQYASVFRQQLFWTILLKTVVWTVVYAGLPLSGNAS